MKLSVVIPTCRRLPDLTRCLRSLEPSLQGVDLETYECVVSDDSRSITAGFVIRTKFPWVRWTQGRGKGPAANRNHGAREAVGSWIAFLDDDCIADAGWVHALLERGAG